MFYIIGMIVVYYFCFVLGGGALIGLLSLRQTFKNIAEEQRKEDAKKSAVN